MFAKKANDRLIRISRFREPRIIVKTVAEPFEDVKGGVDLRTGQRAMKEYGRGQVECARPGYNQGRRKFFQQGEGRVNWSCQGVIYWNARKISKLSTA
jgi:hypothetical protein